MSTPVEASTVTMKPTITVPLELYTRMQYCVIKMVALQQHGVAKWPGYETAMVDALAYIRGLGYES